jgi:glycosyltransferase involved in cell wall biosynthesis
MISICIPAYNYPIQELVKALANQIKTVQGSEILVIDDGSEKEFIEQYDSLKLLCTIELLPNNIGRSAIRNRFVSKAKNEFLLFLDCDSLIPSDDFLANYVSSIDSETNVACGGRNYPIAKPKSSQMLRWKYGHLLESETASKRNKNPHQSFLSNNFLIKKETLHSYPFEEKLKKYGHEDTLFGYKLKKHSIPIKHIENPIINGHLETNVEFLEKTEESINSLYVILSQVIKEEEFINSIRLLSYYNKNRKWVDGFVQPVFPFIKKLIFTFLSKGFISMRLFSFYKLGLVSEKMHLIFNNQH